MKRFLKVYPPLFWRAGLMALMVVFLLAAVMPRAGQAAEYWKQKYERFSATAGETLAVGDAVCLANTDGKAYKADANDSSLRPAVGIIDKGGSTDTTVEIVSRGILGGQTAASPGKRVFLSETAGALTVTMPTNAQGMGFVLPGTTDSSTTYCINVQVPTNTGAGY